MRYCYGLFRLFFLVMITALTACTTTPVSVPANAPLSAAVLVGPEWIVTVVEGVPLVQNPRPRLRWSSMDNFSGSGGCNSFHGQALITGNSLRVVALVPVGKPCLSEPGSQEDLFFKALETARKIRIESGQLQLLGEEGQVLLRLVRAVNNP